MSAVDLLLFTDCAHDAVKPNEESKDTSPKQQEDPYIGGPI